MTSPQNSEGLLAFVAQMGGERQLRVEESLGDGYVRLRVAEAERRQAKHDIRCVEDIVIEMLRNARDAGARHIYVAMIREGEERTLVMLDDGVGIPLSMQQRIFEARVTSKLESVHMDRWGVHGRGMALYSVRENAKEARVVTSAPGMGAAILVRTDASELPERTDQSSWPVLGTDDDGNASIVRGPHNIIRTCCEFALEEQGRCEVYVGSPSEIVATARRRVKPSFGASDLLFIDSIEEVPVLERLSVAVDAQELAQAAESVGLGISERTAHRIVAGQIKPLRSVYSRLTHASSPEQAHEVDLYRDRRGLRISKDDAREFSRIMERDFEYLGQRYYVNLASEPRIRVSKGRLTVTFELEDED